MNTVMQSATNTNLIRVYWTNHEYFASEQFATIEAADAHARSIGFEATFMQAGEVIAARSTFGGFRTFGGVALTPARKSITAAAFAASLSTAGRTPAAAPAPVWHAGNGDRRTLERHALHRG